MSDSLSVCTGCSRHVREGATSCPFCGTSMRDASWRRVGAGVLLAMAASATLHACYGAPAPCPSGVCDYDRDAQVDGGDAASDTASDTTGDR